MAPRWVEVLIGSLEQKRRYRQIRARIDGLPEPHRTAARAMERYFMYYGGVTDGDTALSMWADLADLWERAAVDGTDVHAIVGDDPVEFAETFTQAYSGKHWIDRERARLKRAIEEAERGQQK